MNKTTHAYETPELTDFGSLASLTLASDGTFDDAVKSLGNPPQALGTDTPPLRVER